MAPNRPYANYPGARAAPQQAKSDKAPKEDENPVLRGMPLVIGASLITNSGYLQRFLWGNAKFGLIRNIPELMEYRYRFHPDVVPLPDETTSQATNLLSFGPELTTARLASTQASDRKGYFTIADYHALYASGAATPLQVVSALLPLTRRGQDPPGKYEKAWVTSYGREEERVLAAARASTDRWAQGKPLGPLDGVPISVKDDVSVEGYISHIGMKYNPAYDFFKPATETAWPVKKLQEAGAIVVGKNSMHELGSDTSGCNPSWGTPTNWHNPDYYPGGSSSGGASAVSAGMIPVAVGTDAGGSIRIPASFNGLYGLKPTHHRTQFMSNTNCVAGPIAASVADLTIAYRVMSQSNPDDANQCALAPSIPPSLTPTSSNRKILAVDQTWWSQADSQVQSLCQKALGHYETLGYTILPIPAIPFLRESQLVHSLLCITEMFSEMQTRVPPPRSFFPLLNSPNRLLLSVAGNTPAADLLAAGRMRHLVMSHLASLWEQYPGLLIVTPTSPLRGWKKQAGDESYGLSDANVTIKNMVFVFMANLAGCPAVSVPVGYADPCGVADDGSGEGATSKIPIGLQAMGEWGSEEQLIEFAGDAERYLEGNVEGGRVRPEGWLDVFELAKGEGNEVAVDSQVEAGSGSGSGNGSDGVRYRGKL